MCVRLNSHTQNVECDVRKTEMHLLVEHLGGKRRGLREGRGGGRFYPATNPLNHICSHPPSHAPL